MSVDDLPGDAVDCRLEEVLADGARVVCGNFISRGSARRTQALLKTMLPAQRFEVVPQHPELALEGAA